MADIEAETCSCYEKLCRTTS